MQTITFDRWKAITNGLDPLCVVAHLSGDVEIQQMAEDRVPPEGGTPNPHSQRIQKSGSYFA